jgi:polar amino acid transport system substrate-binding protein
MTWRLSIPVAVFTLISVTLLNVAAISAESPASIRVVTEEFPPFNYTENGRLTGLSTEVVEAVLLELGVTGDFQVMPWARAMQTAQNEENVLIYSIYRNEQREVQYKWVGPISESHNNIYALKSRNIKLRSLDDAKQYSVGIINRDREEDYFLKHGFSFDTNIESAPNHELNYSKLRSGRIDLWPIDQAAMAYYVRKAGDDPQSMVEPVFDVAESSATYQGYFMAFGMRTSDELVERFRKALGKLKTSGKIDQIGMKWLN